MPSFDIVSEVDSHELQNAIDQVNRELNNRFDFKDSNASLTLNEKEMILSAENSFQVEQINRILEEKFSRRKIDTRCLQREEINESNNRAQQIIHICQGISKEDAKQIVKKIKEQKIKVQASIQGDEVRVSGKKRDDLQRVIQLLKETEKKLPLQFINFRD